MWLLFQNLIAGTILGLFIYNGVEAPGISGPFVAFFFAWLLTKVLAKLIDWYYYGFGSKDLMR